MQIIEVYHSSKQIYIKYAKSLASAQKTTYLIQKCCHIIYIVVNHDPCTADGIMGRDFGQTVQFCVGHVTSVFKWNSFLSRNYIIIVELYTLGCLLCCKKNVYFRLCSGWYKRACPIETVRRIELNDLLLHLCGFYDFSLLRV